jgi:hypothetical protein
MLALGTICAATKLLQNLLWAIQGFRFEKMFAFLVVLLPGMRCQRSGNSIACALGNLSIKHRNPKWNIAT